MAISLNTLTRTAMMQGGMGNLVYLKVYADPRPAPDEEPVATPLAIFMFNNLPAPADGQVWTTEQPTTNALGTGTATWGRWTDDTNVPANPGSKWVDGSVGTTGSDFKLDTTALVQGEAVQFLSLRLTLPAE